jgi:hypothetical protein
MQKSNNESTPSVSDSQTITEIPTTDTPTTDTPTTDTPTTDTPTTDTPTTVNYVHTPMKWSSIAKDGNVTDVDDVDGSWISAGGQSSFTNHGGKILPKFQKKVDPENSEKEARERTNLSGDDNGGKSEEDPVSPVFMIFSQWTIPEIEDHIFSAADSDDQIGMIRIDYFKGEQTDRTIVVMDPSLYHKLHSNRVSGFSITPYDVRPHWFPQEKVGETFNFFVPLPSSLSTAACREGLRVKLEELVRFGMFESESDYGIFIPVADREGTEHTNRAYIEFDSKVDHDAIVMARCVLSYSKWSYKNSHVDDTNNVLVKCYYKKDNRSEGGRFQTKDSAEKSPRHKVKSSPKASVRPRVSLKIPTIPVDSKSNTNPFELLSSDNAE